MRLSARRRDTEPGLPLPFGPTRATFAEPLRLLGEATAGWPEACRTPNEPGLGVKTHHTVGGETGLGPGRGPLTLSSAC